MRDVMSWCRVVLVQRLSTDEKFKTQFVETEFWRERPLQIAVANNDAGLVGFKPPWQKAQCLTAIDQRQMYEAAINIDWLGTISANADDRIIAGDEVTFADVVRIRSTLMIIDDDVLESLASSQTQASFCDPAESSLVADSGKQLQRQHRDLRLVCCSLLQRLQKVAGTFRETSGVVTIGQRG
jgi:hypothetical protein